MAKGLRIHHPSYRNCIIMMYQNAPSGKRKEIPIHLDENGDSIVCIEIWDSMVHAEQTIGIKNEFIVLNEVLDPPTLLSGWPTDHDDIMKPVMVQTENGVNDPQLLAVAQKFAPKGVKPRISLN